MAFAKEAQKQIIEYKIRRTTTKRKESDNFIIGKKLNITL